MIQMYRSIRILSQSGLCSKVEFRLPQAVLSTFSCYPNVFQSQQHIYRREICNKVSIRHLSHQDSTQSRAVSTRENGVFTIPNILTFSRICITPAIGYFIWHGMHSNALACFGYAAISDMLDGFIARRFKQKSDVGILLDPIADKLLLTTSLVTLCMTDVIPIWFAKGFVYRDMILLAGATCLRYFGFKEPPNLKKFFDFKNHPTRGLEPTLTSKCNTALLCTVIALHLGTNHMVGIPIYDYTMLALHILNAILATMSLAQYTMRMAR